MSERDIQQAILLAVGSRPDVRLWRTNAGMARSLDGKRIIRLGIPGLTDLSGILADGRALFIEAKSASGRQTAEQQAFEAIVRKFGGVYLVARSVEEALAGIWEDIPSPQEGQL